MANNKQILLIRMQSLGEIAAIAVPAIRYYREKYPDADFTVLTYGQGEKVIQLAEPEVKVTALMQGRWPNELFPAMETFLGLAEQIIGVGYDEIINLDTSFMPCFLARFLKDAGEKVTGNSINLAIPELLEQFQNQELKPEYVQDPALFMDSSFFTMACWHTAWWDGAYIPDGGYPEYYLTRACGLSGLQMNDKIELPISPNSSADKKLIALAISVTEQDQGFAYSKQLQWALEEAGFNVSTELKMDTPVKRQLEILAQADLLITLPRDSFWLAKAVGCPRLLFSNGAEPQTLMAEYTVEEALESIKTADVLSMVKDIVNQAQHS